jgi:hypothetical protein
LISISEHFYAYFVQQGITTQRDLLIQEKTGDQKKPECTKVVHYMDADGSGAGLLARMQSDLLCNSVLDALKKTVDQAAGIITCIIILSIMLRKDAQQRLRKQKPIFF